MIDRHPPLATTLECTIDKFWEVYPPFWNQVKAHIRSVASDQFGISVEQFHILRFIRKGQGSASEIARVQRISRPAISQAVDALAHKGLITRQQDARDRRHVQLALTEDGCSLLDSISSDTRQWMRIEMAALSEAELETIIAALEALKKITRA